MSAVGLPAAVLGAIAIPDLVTFVVAAAVVLASALGVVLARNPIHSALFLVATLFGVAVLFVEQQAEFLAAVQVIVYAGAIVVLFLFVIMLLGVDRPEKIARDPLPAQRPLAIFLALVGLAELFVLAGARWATGAKGTVGPPGGPTNNIVQLARAVFTTYLLPFEVTSALLVIAVVGAVVLARPGNAGQPLDAEAQRVDDDAEAIEAPEEPPARSGNAEPGEATAEAAR